MRIASSGFLVLVMIFCGYVFLCTYEPNPPDVQLRWRIIYGGLAAMCLVGIVWNTWTQSKPPE
jgi:uncharacterized membrane protein